jgi:hypothetical protein
VVLDLNLPVIHGFEVIKTIRARAQSFVAASDLRSKFLTERVVAFPSVHSFDVLGDDKNFISISLNYRDGHLATNARLLIRSRYGAEAESRAV